MRQLLWMFDGLQRSEWGRTASLAASVHASMTGQRIDPQTMIPDRYRDKPREVVKSPERVEEENRMAWMLLGIAFGVKS